MTTDATSLTVSGVLVSVVRKPIKNLHLGVYPPDGRVRVAAPPSISDAAVRVAVISRLRWIKQQQASFAGQRRESPRELVSGESHYYRGRRYRLAVAYAEGRPSVRVVGGWLRMTVPAGTSAEGRALVLDAWYRERLRWFAAPLVAAWQATLGVEVRFWGIKRMKTKWGSCNATARRIWLNVELVKKPPSCLEYVIAHELMHLRVAQHDHRFIALMQRHLPSWARTRAELNASPIVAASWGAA